MPRVAVLLPTTTYRATDFVKAAAALDVDLVVVSDRRQLLADAMGDSFLEVDLDSPEAAARSIAAAGPFDAVVAPDDRGVVTGALAAAELGLDHNPPASVAATRNKVALRRALRDHVPQPPYQVVGLGGDVGTIAAELGFPVVLKPLSRSASQGVIRADDADAAVAAERRIRRILTTCGANPNEPILVERFVPGPEVAVEGMLIDGRLEVLAVFDKPDPLDGPFFEETIYVTPSRHHPEVVTGVVDLVRTACEALGLVTGPVHAEVRIDRGTPVLIEVAARPIGGHCGRALRFGLLGTSHETLLLRGALGRPTAGLGLSGAVGALMLPIPHTGRLEAVHGVDEAAALAHVDGVEVAIPIGERVEAAPDGDRYLGFAFASADDPATVEAALRAVLATVRVEVAAAT